MAPATNNRQSVKKNHRVAAGGTGGSSYDNSDKVNYSNNKCHKCCCSCRCLKKMSRAALRKLGKWLLEVEMGFVWGVAGISIFVFVFAAIWYIDPALLTLVLQFRQAKCTTVSSKFLVGISNCTWTSCRLGCTREVFKCWQIMVDFEYEPNSAIYGPPWATISVFENNSAEQTRLYPNVRGCGYPPELNCEAFYETYGPINGSPFKCWVSNIDQSIAMTHLDLDRAKSEVIYSLIPLLIFIIFVLYAFCRQGVFSVCNPIKMCPRGNNTSIVGGANLPDLPSMTPKQLLSFRRQLAAARPKATSSSSATAAMVTLAGTAAVATTVKAAADIPSTIVEDEEDSSETSRTTHRTQRSRPPSTASIIYHTKPPEARQLESPELTEVSPFVVEDTTASTSVAASRPSTRLRIRRGGHSSDDDGGDLNLIPLKPVSALKNDQDHDVASLASLGSFFAVKAFKHNSSKDDGDANTVINELFTKDIVKDAAATQPHITDASSAAATVQQIQQPKFFHGAPKSAATVDEGDLDLLDELLSAASLNLETPERLRRKGPPPPQSEDMRLKSASSGFSAWTNDFLSTDDAKSTKKD